MSYLFVVVFGVVSGWIAGQMVKGSEMGVLPDLGAGALGAVVFVFLSRVFGGPAAATFLISAIIAIIGGGAMLYAMRYVMKETPVPARRPRR